MSSRNKKKSNSAPPKGRKKPSPTAQILEHVELLIALHEEQSENNRSASPASEFLVDDIAQKLESQIEKRFDSIEEQLASSKSELDESEPNLDDSLAKLVDRFDTIESKLAVIEDKLEDAGKQPLSAPKIQERFEAIDTRLEKVATAISGQQQLIEGHSSSADASVVDSFQEQFSEMLSQIRTELTNASQGITDGEQEEANEADDKEPSRTEPDWSRRKQAMLSKYGIDPEHRPDMAPPTAPDPVLETTIADGQLSPTIELESVDKEIPTEPEEIQKIRKELNIKLRDAEVELSIERAKLSQLEAELESKQVELDRRNLELTEKFSSQRNNPGSGEQASLLDRLKRHLTAKDRKNLDRI